MIILMAAKYYGFAARLLHGFIAFAVCLLNGYIVFIAYILPDASRV